MKQDLLLQWRPMYRSLFPPFLPSLSVSFPTRKQPVMKVYATLESTDTQQLTARERRRLRNERRENKGDVNWREEVEKRLIQKPKKRYRTKSEQLNLDTLLELGQQWWVVRVSRSRGQETAEVLARLLARKFPELDFKVYAPAVRVRKKLKNGTISIKPKPVLPGCVFLKSVLNKEIHDFIREVDGVGGFVGAKVGTNKRQINKPRPVSEDDMEALFKQAKEEQEKADREFEEENQQSGSLNSKIFSTDSESDLNDVENTVKDTKSKKQSSLSVVQKYKLLVPGSEVQVVSGNFTGFVGSLKKLSRKTGKAAVGFTLFGRETLVDLDVNEIIPKTQWHTFASH